MVWEYEGWCLDPMWGCGDLSTGVYELVVAMAWVLGAGAGEDARGAR